MQSASAACKATEDMSTCLRTGECLRRGERMQSASAACKAD
jgi:hypothetical protein